MSLKSAAASNPAEWKELREQWLALGRRLAGGVYDFGFLKR